MSARGTLAAVLATLVLSGAQSGHRSSRRWAQYESEMQNPVDDPPDAWEDTEFAFARLRFRSPRDGYYWRSRWGADCNKSERQFIQGLRRLTRIHARSVEQIVDIDSDEIYDWPWLYAIAVGDWVLSGSQVDRLRRYFERGGFLMVDDFHGEREWKDFMAGISRILPGHQVVELTDDDPIFHVVYSLEERYHVPGLQIVRGQPYERGGIGEHWRAVLEGPRASRDLLQHGPRGCVGMGGLSALSGALRRAGLPDRGQLCGVRNDALRRTCL